MAPDKFLLIKGKAGLGNRIESALTGMLYARLTGRQLLIDWSDEFYSANGANSFHSFFESRQCSPRAAIPATDSVRPAIWRGHLRQTAWEMWEDYKRSHWMMNPRRAWRVFSCELTRLDHEEDLLVMWTYSEKLDSLRGHFRGAFKELAHTTNSDILRKLLREDLTLHPRLRERVDEFRAAFRKPTLGVHVRLSDRRTQIERITKAIGAFLERQPGALIFLATDNIQIKLMFEQAYPAVITTPHWYPSTPGAPMHMPGCHPNPTESGMDALVDLYLLAECDSLIVDTNSSFSYLATLLSEVPAAEIVDVAGWKRRPPRYRRIVDAIALETGLSTPFSWGLGTVNKFVKLG